MRTDLNIAKDKMRYLCDTDAKLLSMALADNRFRTIKRCRYIFLFSSEKVRLDIGLISISRCTNVISPRRGQILIYMHVHLSANKRRLEIAKSIDVCVLENASLRTMKASNREELLYVGVTSWIVSNVDFISRYLEPFY